MVRNECLIFIFPSCYEKWTEIDNILKAKFSILDKKLITLGENEKFNLIKAIYKNEEWLGDENNNYDGLFYKMGMCFPNELSEFEVYLVLADDKSLMETKKEIRDLCKVDNHSIHTTDSGSNISSFKQMYFNKNSMDINLIDG